MPRIRAPVAVEAFFLPAGPDGQRFCMFHAPGGRPFRGAVLYVHPFAEEMNKSRRMVALQSRMFAENGFAVLHVDLHGCGDSSGDFGDATWEGWIDDVLLAREWLRSRAEAPLWLWGLRAGCLLVSAAASRLAEPTRLLLWQPTPLGNAVLRQFLRVQTAGDMIAGGTNGGTDVLRAKLAAGETIEVAGYGIAASLALALETAKLDPCDRVTRLHWLEVSARDGVALSPAAARAVEPWQSAERFVETRVVGGPQFWQTTEIEEAPELLTASLAALQQETEGQ